VEKKIRITKEFHFEMAHALLNYKGLCSSIHGHSYVLSVTLIGEPINNSTDPNNGMVLDFSILKDIIKKNIIQKLDHSLLLNADTPGKESLQANKLFEKVVFTEFQPSCENLLLDFVSVLKDKFPAGVKLFSLKLLETDTSFAEWYASDNEI
jgi:6-pyruvoyltetrahydropterin/6-carboxytetrahydropterin synthase